MFESLLSIDCLVITKQYKINYSLNSYSCYRSYIVRFVFCMSAHLKLPIPTNLSVLA